jgi:hypothetical protein
MHDADRRSDPVTRRMLLIAIALSMTLIGAGAGAGCAASGNGGGMGGGAVDTTPDDPTTTRPPALDLLDAACAGGLHVENVATVTGPELTEASGIAASRVNAEKWWVHNDSGDSARFFLVGASGGLLTTVTVDGATAHDWEDIAVGPPVAATGAGSVYLADIGDNDNRRASVVVYRAAEPIIALDAVGATTHVAADALTFTYPDGPHDAETLMVDPSTGDLVIITKDWSFAGHSVVYRAPGDLAGGSTTVLEKVATLALPVATLVTGGDVSSDGSVVALRSYRGVDLYARPAGQPLWSAFTSTPCAGPAPVEKQGEAIGFAANGADYATISEGAAPMLHLTHR